VGVVLRRQAGPDVEELRDTGVGGQVLDGPAEEAARRAGDVDDLREDLAELVADLAVDGVVVLAAEPVVPDPGRATSSRSVTTPAPSG
jgi:hypothetical protein